MSEKKGDQNFSTSDTISLYKNKGHKMTGKIQILPEVPGSWKSCNIIDQDNVFFFQI